jgi:hypothetical protein
MTDTDVDEDGNGGRLVSSLGGDDDPPLEASDEIDADELDWERLMENGHYPDVIDLPPPETMGSRWGMLGDFLQWRKRHKKEKKLAKQGYVRWHLVDGTWGSPKYVKPELKGGGIREHKEDGIRYLFPDRAKVPDSMSGMWTYVHKHGESQPINMAEPSELAIKGDELDEYITKKVTSDPPSWLDSFDFDFSKAIQLAVALVIVFALAQQAMTML